MVVNEERCVNRKIEDVYKPFNAKYQLAMTDDQVFFRCGCHCFIFASFVIQIQAF